MSSALDFAVRAVVAGIGATALLDAWAWIQRRVFGIASLDWALVGRWLGHMPRGRYVHRNIAAAAAVRGERWLGWGFHYIAGIALAGLLLAIMGTGWARAPTLGPCIALGIGSVLLPFLIMQPGLGAGIASARLPAPWRARARSVSTHAMFGVFLYLALTAASRLLPG